MKILITFLSLALFSSDYEWKKNCRSHLDNKTTIDVSVDKVDIFEYLDETKEALEETVEGLSEEQMAFKQNEEHWSVAEIVEHIIIVEGALKSLLESKIEAGETPEQIAEVKMTDDQVIGLITDRSGKVQTQDQFKPSGKFTGADEALEAFNDQREDIVDWLKDSDADMRNYVNEFPFGKIDAYQTVLFMAGHTMRHTKQIDELKSNPDFSKS